MSYQRVTESSNASTPTEGSNPEVLSNRYVVATSLLERQAAEVRLRRPNWPSYLQCTTISQDEFKFIYNYDNATTSEKRDQILKETGNLAAAKMFLNLMVKISKEQAVQYILTLVDDMLQEDKEKVIMFFEHAKKTKSTAWAHFLNMLNRDDKFIVNQSARIVAKLACGSVEGMNKSDLVFYMSWLRSQINNPGNEYVTAAAGCLQMMLYLNKYRQAFMETDGLTTFVTVLAGKASFQLQYQLTYCIWMITFNTQLVMDVNKFNIIPVLSDILHESVKEKVTRIILATFRNLIEKPEEKEAVQENALSMVQCKVLKQLEILEAQKFDDPDITEDIEYLGESLRASVHDLSSFDEYSSEVRSGRLEWSPVHKSEKFWRENAVRLNEKNYELLKILKHLLEVSRDPLILAVASHDIGEYVRHYPRGKHIIETIHAKELVMKLMTHDDPNVRYEALLAVQKIMVHNWEYLGKQLQAT